MLKPSLHYGLQDTKSFEATTSTDHSSKYWETCSGEKYRETCSGEIDFRSQGLLHSTIRQTDHTSQEAVKKLIHQFETHPHREALKANLRQNHALNPFSEQTKDMIYSWETWSTSRCARSLPKVQCHHCFTYWTKGIVYCTCGTCLRPSEQNSQSQQGSVRCFCRVQTT